MTQVIQLNATRQLLVVSSLENSEGFTLDTDGLDNDDILR